MKMGFWKCVDAQKVQALAFQPPSIPVCKARLKEGMPANEVRRELGDSNPGLFFLWLKNFPT